MNDDANDRATSRAVEARLAAWATERANAVDTLTALAALGETRAVACAVVRFGKTAHEVLGSAEARQAAATFVVFAEAAGARRELATGDDARARAANAASEGSAAPTWSWMASEPIVDAKSSHVASVVVLGTRDDDREDALVRLQEIAAACRPVVLREHVLTQAATIAHRLNNLLATAVANVDYAAELTAEMDRADASDRDRGDLAVAIQNSKTATHALAEHIQALRVLTTREP